MEKVKIRKIGNSLGVILPKDMLNRLRLEEGDEVSLVEGKDAVTVKTYDSEFERQMKVAEAIMHKRRNVLRQLAK